VTAEAASRKDSPGCTLPPGNSQSPPYLLPWGRWHRRYFPSLSMTAATTLDSILGHTPDTRMAGEEDKFKVAGLTGSCQRCRGGGSCAC
jgi:hypothetical protein